MLRVLAVLAVAAVGATTVLGQNLPVIQQRQEAMDAIGKASLANFKMMKGEAPFDLAKLQAGLKIMQDEAGKLKALFPEDSKTGGDTEATAKIWQSKSEFEAAVDTLISEVKSAAGAIKDEATLKAEYPKVANSCGNCHKNADGFAPRLADSLKRLN